MLLLFASCLNCYVHGAFLFRGESCFIFIVKYKAVPSRIREESRFRPAWKRNRWLIVSASEGLERWKYLAVES